MRISLNESKNGSKMVGRGSFFTLWFSIHFLTSFAKVWWGSSVSVTSPFSFTFFSYERGSGGMVSRKVITRRWKEWKWEGWCCLWYLLQVERHFRPQRKKNTNTFQEEETIIGRRVKSTAIFFQEQMSQVINTETTSLPFNVSEVLRGDEGGEKLCHLFSRDDCHDFFSLLFSNDIDSSPSSIFPTFPPSFTHSLWETQWQTWQSFLLMTEENDPTQFFDLHSAHKGEKKERTESQRETRSLFDTFWWCCPATKGLTLIIIRNPFCSPTLFHDIKYSCLHPFG